MSTSTPNPTPTRHIKTTHYNMSIRNILLALVAVLGASSCGDRSIRGGGTTLHFYPRVCTQMFTLPQEEVDIVEEAGGKVYRRHEYRRVKGKAVRAERFILWLMTGADDLNLQEAKSSDREPIAIEGDYDFEFSGRERKRNMKLAPSIPTLERQLQNDYTQWGRGFRGLSSTHDSGLAHDLRPWPYRVTGVKDFRIISLSPLFGQPAESSLNDYFIIDEFSPRQVISYRRKALLWGYSDKGKVTNIRQWLSMEPMAPPAVIFRLKRRPEELPIKTKLVSILKTTEDKELRDTLEVELK